MQGKQRIGIFLSGRPGQRELGIVQGGAISAALATLGHEGVPLFLDRDLDLLVRQANISSAFLALQGRQGEDGCLQGFLEVMGIAYTGSGVTAAALASHRIKTKEILRLNNLPTSPGYLFNSASGDSIADAHGQFGYPVTVRPVRERVHVLDNLAYDEMELEAAVDDVFRVDEQALIERHVQGRNVEVGILDGEPLGALELMRDSTRAAGGSIVACRLSEARLRSILRLATLAYEAVGCAGAATVQIQLSESGNEIVRDLDTMPVLTPTAPFARIAKTAGIGFAELVGRLLRGAGLRGQSRDHRRQLQSMFANQDRRTDAYSVTAH